MQRLWAPWRMVYIKDIPQSDGCFLCDAAHAERLDVDNLVLWRDELTLCIMNRYPYNNGHLLIAPHGHVGEIAQLEPRERAALMDALVRAQDMLALAMTPDGFNIGLNLGRTAGAGVEDHLHFHVVPRWNGDTNFMPVISDTKVVPQALSDLYEKLRETLGS